MCGRQVSKVPGLAHTPPVLAWGRGLHPTQPFCSLCPYLHRCGSQGDSGTGTLQTLGLLWRVDRGNMVSACWLPVLDIGKTLPTKSTPTQTLHINMRSRGLSPPTTESQGILVIDLQLLLLNLPNLWAVGFKARGPLQWERESRRALGQ